jgi:hypothetical protein
MLFALKLAKLVLSIAGMLLMGQGALYVLAGAGRDKNIIYQLFQQANKPWVALARFIVPRQVAPQHVPVVAFCLVAVAYLAVVLMLIEHCVSIGMALCR